MELRVTLRMCEYIIYNLFTLRTSSPWHMSSNYITYWHSGFVLANEHPWTMLKLWESTTRNWQETLLPNEPAPPSHTLVLAWTWHGHALELHMYVRGYVNSFWVFTRCHGPTGAAKDTRKLMLQSSGPLRYQSSSPSPNHSTTLIYSAMGDSIVFVANHKAYCSGIKLHRKKSQSWTLIYSNNIIIYKNNDKYIK